MNTIQLTDKSAPLVKADGQRKLAGLQKAIESEIIGQQDLIQNMLICLLCDGHMLIEGMPGLAKTTAAKAIAQAIQGDFHRIQFTPDLLPSDLIGTEIYVHEKSDFTFRKGPIFNNILLADEINWLS
jgi:MoxR-like ATPase